MPVVPLNMHLKWFLRIVAIKLINHIEKCAGTIMRKVCWYHYVVKVCRYPHAIKLLHHIEKCASTIKRKSVLVPLCGQSVPVPKCYQIAPSYRKMCSYPHVLYYFYELRNFTNTKRKNCPTI